MELEGSLLDAGHERTNDLHRVLTLLLERDSLMFIKGFDTLAADDDPENVYMEREWRTAYRRMGFTLANVHRVFLPASYAVRFRDDVPEYHNQVSFVEG
jgi:hypothetical protein